MSFIEQVNNLINEYQSSRANTCACCCLDNVVKELNKASLTGHNTFTLIGHPNCLVYIVNNLPDGITVNGNVFTVTELWKHNFLGTTLNELTEDLQSHIISYASMGITEFDRAVVVRGHDFNDEEKGVIIEYLRVNFDSNFVISNVENNIHVRKL